MDSLLKKVRVNDGITVSVYSQGKRKYTILEDNGVSIKSVFYRDPYSDDYFIDIALRSYEFTKKKESGYYYVIQDPFKDNSFRVYGKDPFYISNGSSIYIKWFGDIPNSDFNPGSLDPNDVDGLPGYPSRYLSDIELTSLSDNDLELPKSNWSYNGVYDSSTIRYKLIEVHPSSDDVLIIVDNKFIYKKDLDSDESSVKFDGSISDMKLLSIIIEKLSKQTMEVNGLSEYDLSLCTPDSSHCDIIKYLSPIEYIQHTKDDDNLINSDGVNKVKLSIDGLPKDITLRVGDDLPMFTIWAGDIPRSNVNSEFEDLDEIYTESGYMGYEETGIDFSEWLIQGDISTYEEDSSSIQGTVGPPANISTYSTFDQLIEMAGRCARELGKNPRVNATNLKMTYKKGIHGLCPQGTLSVLYALTGLKELGTIRGNADWFSFKNPTNPMGGEGKSDLSLSGYFNNKVRINQINGSWKGTYILDRNQWQIGDVVAMGYTNGKKYGHIQVWTGFCWMSDFVQGYSIQQNNVDNSSVALWRLNKKGMEAVNRQRLKLV